MSAYHCRSVNHSLRATVSLPGSKSITNRALTAAALADGTSTLRNMLFADDTRRMIDALRAFGAAIEVDPARGIAVIHGTQGRLPTDDAEIACGNAGTVLRFATALAALGMGCVRLNGVARMRRRPIGPLVDILRQLGARCEYEEAEGCPPIIVHGRGLHGGHVSFPAIPSSQFVSAVLLMAPYVQGDLYLDLPAETPSLSYVNMTLAVMEQFGVVALCDRGMSLQTARSPFAPNDSTSVDPRIDGESSIRIIVETPQRYRPVDCEIEPDASSASYFLAAALFATGSVTVTGLGTKSVQSDVRFVDILEQMGCRVRRENDALTVSRPSRDVPIRAVDVDMCDMPDAVPTLAVCALLADGPTRIRNVAHLRLKESDRLAALRTELTKLGAKVEELPDGLIIHPPKRLRPATIHPYDDHRIAMSFALAGLICPALVIENPECCAKSLPDFFDRFERMCESTDRNDTEQ